MSTKLKLLILEKVIPEIKNNNIRSYISNFQLIHKHADNNHIIEIAGPGVGTFAETNPNDKLKFIEKSSSVLKLSVDKDYFITNVLESIIHRPQVENVSRKIVMDFSSPNIAKPFHVGHLRSTIIGDWGTQFGVLQYGLNEKNIQINDLKNDPIKKLYEAYVYANKLAATDENVLKEARKYFSNIECGKANIDEWKKIKEVTVNELANIYQRLGISFDEYHWESDYNGERIKNVIKLLLDRNIIKSDESGKKIATVRDRNVTILKSDNSTLYLSRDIAALLDRYERYQFDEMLYIVDNAQTDHFNAVFDIVKQVNEDCANACKHIKFGRIQRMSTRSGNVVFLNDILDEAKDKMFEKQKQSKNTRESAMDETTCDILGTTAVVVNDLKQRRQRDYIFEWDKALQSDGDSGIKLQYLHCRLWSLEKKCNVSLPDHCDPKYLQEPIILKVISELSRFDDVLIKANNELEACIIVNYLFRLARHVNRMFNELNVKNVEPDLAAQRLLVFNASRLVVKTGLEILGVKVLYEM